MKLFTLSIVIVTMISASLADGKSYNDYKESNGYYTGKKVGTRHIRQADADEMVQNILQWLQTIYKQNSRKTRQQNLVRGYLPPVLNPERPRPFEMPTQKPYQTTPASIGTVYNGNIGNIGTVGQPGPFSPTSSAAPGYQYTETIPQSPQIPTISTNVPVSQQTPQPSQPSASSPSYQESSVSTSKYRPEGPFSTQPSGTRPFPTSPPQIEPFPSSSSLPDQNIDDGANHPPHIHDLNVDCAKDMMTIKIEFNRPYDGIIYSKGFYSNPECRYVQENSGQSTYQFTVSLNSCGTEFINGFDTQGQSYLENVLVLQNEPGIQEVWDTIRSVRCLWAGNLNKALSIPLSIGMLNQEIVTFSGDTAMASLDIQQGRGPFAGPANGLVKIGDIMTLVVSITGDPGFDVRVRDCRARDSGSQNVVMLTDTDGCVLKPKLFGAFQKTRQTQNTGASIIAYAYFNAFKFPDMMDLIMECNVELCKTDCEMCPRPGQNVEPGRRRRDTYAMRYNETIGAPITIKRALRVILPQDLGSVESPLVYKEVCVSLFEVATITGLILGTLVIFLIVAIYYRNKYQNLSKKC